MWILSVSALSVTAFLCIAGVLADAYDDNLGQRIGMAILCIGSSSRALAIAQTHEVSPDWLVVHVGIGLFALSTAWRCLHRYLEKRAGLIREKKADDSRQSLQSLQHADWK